MKARMAKSMRTAREDWTRTRESLVRRLKCQDDQESWRDFVDLYYGLFYSTSIKAGLNDSEAQDVVQETIIHVSKKMERFRYDPAVDSFKGWLLYLTRKHIAQEYRRRARRRRKQADDLDEFNAEIEALPDPAGLELEKIWDEEWQKTMWDAAIGRVKEQVSPQHFQMFDLYVLKERPPKEVARALGVAVAQVYLVKHRISGLVERELLQLRAKLE